MAVTTITVHHAHSGDFSNAPPASAVDVLARATGFLVTQGLIASASPGAVDASVSQSVASGTLTFSGASGMAGANIAGEPVTVEAGASDSETAAAFAQEVAISGTPFTDYVTASVAGNVVTLSATSAGPLGNLVALSTIGSGVTASGPFLAGG